MDIRSANPVHGCSRRNRYKRRKREVSRFLVISKQIDVPVPMEVLKKLLPAQFTYLKGLRQSGKVECNYGYAGAKGGLAIVNAESHEELQGITNGYPMSPFITLEIHPLITLEEMEKSATEMLKRAA
jgi:muconolactone delta-isomerase